MIGTWHYHVHVPILAQITSQLAISVTWSQYCDIWDHITFYTYFRTSNNINKLPMQTSEVEVQYYHP